MADRPDDQHVDSAAETGISTGDGTVPDEEALERRSEEALATGLENLPSTGLLSFYDRLRERILARIDRRGGKMADATVRALLLVPDVFILLVRLAMDREVPSSARMMIGGALAYFVLPMDLMPEALLGAGGFLDDLVLATAVLSQAFSGELEPYARRHWSGSEDLRVVIQDIAYTAENLLGAKLYGRVEHLLARRGIRLPETEA
ncbi:MAG: YkvA family protein [Acidobacteriota bacterium]|jgi:uncharacterized membrane protein YkvA (DUF1232 family)